MRLPRIVSPTILQALRRCAPRGQLQPLFGREISQNFSASATKAASEEDIAHARQWLQVFSDTTIPRTVGDVSYSRSSGPGGQNVNKVNSKAQLRVPLDRLFEVVPIALHAAVRSSRYHAEKTNSLLIQADDSRKQGANKDTCYRKLNQMLLDIGKDVVPGETSPEQQERVKNLKRFENEARLRSKKQHSSKKASRSKSSND